MPTASWTHVVQPGCASQLARSCSNSGSLVWAIWWPGGAVIGIHPLERARGCIAATSTHAFSSLRCCPVGQAGLTPKNLYGGKCSEVTRDCRLGTDPLSARRGSGGHAALAGSAGTARSRSRGTIFGPWMVPNRKSSHGTTRVVSMAAVAVRASATPGVVSMAAVAVRASATPGVVSMAAVAVRASATPAIQRTPPIWGLGSGASGIDIVSPSTTFVAASHVSGDGGHLSGGASVTPSTANWKMTSGTTAPSIAGKLAPAC